VSSGSEGLQAVAHYIVICYLCAIKNRALGPLGLRLKRQDMRKDQNLVGVVGAHPVLISGMTIDRVGAKVLGMLEGAGALVVFGMRATVEAFRPPYEAREIARHVYQFGYRSTPLILTAGLAIGVVLSMHTRAALARFGAEAMIPAGLAIALIRRLVTRSARVP
jgi:Permease MlaE